jgi:hypothetical protein
MHNIKGVEKSERETWISRAPSFTASCVFIYYNMPLKQLSRNKQIATNKINTWSMLPVTQKFKGKEEWKRHTFRAT